MLPTTAEAVRALLKSDPTLTPADRQRIVHTIREHGREPEKEATRAAAPPRILRRAEVAARMGCSVRTVDHWVCCGLLRKLRLPGRSRCIGFLESDVLGLIEKGVELGAGCPAAVGSG